MSSNRTDCQHCARRQKTFAARVFYHRFVNQIQKFIIPRNYWLFLMTYPKKFVVMKKIILSTVFLLVALNFNAVAQKKPLKEVEKVTIDLNHVKDDKVMVTIIPPKMVGMLIMRKNWEEILSLLRSVLVRNGFFICNTIALQRKS